MQVCKFTGMQVYKYASMQVCKYASMQVCRYAGMLVCKYTGIKVCRNCYKNKIIQNYVSLLGVESTPPPNRTKHICNIITIIGN